MAEEEAMKKEFCSTLASRLCSAPARQAILSVARERKSRSDR
jgi:hypothetical protein